MAEEEKEEQKQEDGSKKDKKKKLILYIGIGVVALLLIIAIVVFVFVISGSDEEKNTGGSATVSSKQLQQGAGAGRKIDMANIGPMYEMDDFTVNLLNEGGRRYLRTKIDIEMNSDDLISELDRKKAIVRDTIIQVLSSKQIEEIATIDGKERLKDEIVKALNRLLIDGQIKNVYFTNFVIQ